jgi:hypothetical protein
MTQMYLLRRSEEPPGARCYFDPRRYAPACSRLLRVGQMVSPAYVGPDIDHTPLGNLVVANHG